MRASSILLVAVCLLTVAVLATAFVKPAVEIKKASAGKGFAVVELFTSEGCSSCPAADIVVAKIKKEYADQPVYILAYHVDYWNRLGWRDVFSNAAFSKRQYQYASWIKGSSVYTPQIVVNGNKEFIGSEESTLRNAVKAGEQKVSSAQLTLSELKLNGNKALFTYHTDGASNNTLLVYTIVQHAAQTKVEAGENSGRTLGHVQIVRELQTTALNSSGYGNASIAVPKSLSSHDLEIIAFLQNKITGEITAAYKTDLEDTKMAMAN